MLNLQDMFLNQLRKEKIMVTVYLVNGFQLRGYVKGFDTFTIVVENEGRQNLVYKNAVSTITPTKPVKLLEISRFSRRALHRKSYPLHRKRKPVHSRSRRRSQSRTQNSRSSNMRRNASRNGRRK